MNGGIFIGKTKRKEVRFSDSEWQRIMKLSTKEKKTTMAYIRDKALYGKVITEDDETGGKNERLRKCRNELSRSLNRIAHSANGFQNIYLRDVEDAEKIICEFEEMVEEMTTVDFKEMF